MLKKMTSIVVLLLLCLSFLLPANAPAFAATGQQANTIILEFGSYDADDMRDLHQGEGKIFKRITQIIEQLKEQGAIDEDAQPVIAVVKRKSSSKGLLD